MPGRAQGVAGQLRDPVPEFGFGAAAQRGERGEGRLGVLVEEGAELLVGAGVEGAGDEGGAEVDEQTLGAGDALLVRVQRRCGGGCGQDASPKGERTVAGAVVRFMPRPRAGGML